MRRKSFSVKKRRWPEKKIVVRTLMRLYENWKKVQYQKTITENGPWTFTGSFAQNARESLIIRTGIFSRFITRMETTGTIHQMDQIGRTFVFIVMMRSIPGDFSVIISAKGSTHRDWSLMGKAKLFQRVAGWNHIREEIPRDSARMNRGGSAHREPRGEWTSC